ncbi:aspartate/glutamate racemase family protein [Brevibacillus reuszeri]|uniref:aspartate/glutamate racemase family protein n=1 Tax=Brevibacillus reuszeri TaxID=54915 RepID=UPI00289A7263|nr:aspartate/glutamate racemase family protein [Brevibacillus reuszeri]
MSTKLLYIDPIYSDEDVGLFESHFRKMVEQDTEIDVISLGNKKGPLHLEYNCYEVLAMPDLIRQVIKAEQDGYDGTIIGCFYDPALRACREVSRKMVISAPAEASLQLSATIGESISIIVGRQKWIPQIRENVQKYGFSHKLASIRPLEMGVLDFQKDHEYTMNQIRKAAKEAIEQDGADVLVLGCTAELGFYEKLQEEFRIPVIDVSLAAVKYAEFSVNVGRKLGWSQSKRVGFQSPPMVEAIGFGLFSS